MDQVDPGATIAPFFRSDDGQAHRPVATLVATAKNEGPSIWEWVAYHRMIGFDHIYIFQNDSEDGTQEILKLLDRSGVITYRNNERLQRGRHQVKAYMRAAGQPGYLASDLAMALDLDKFLVIKTGDGSLTALMQALPDFDCAMINWRVFGSAGAQDLSDAPVTQRYTLAEWGDDIRGGLTPFKALFQRDRFERPGVHRPPGCDVSDPDLRFTNGSGLLRDEFTLKNFRSTDPGGRALAQVNHYMVKDAQSFVLKNARGSAHQAQREIGQDYWVQCNKNRQRDTSILRFQDRLVRAMADIDAMTLGKLSRLTAESFAYHQQKFATLMETEESRALYEFCLENTDIAGRVRHHAHS